MNPVLRNWVQFRVGAITREPKMNNALKNIFQSDNPLLQSVKILLLLPKYEIIMLPSNHPFFQHCDGNIGLFSIAPCKVITLNPFSSFLVSILCFFFDASLSKVIALQTIAIAIVVALCRS